MKASPARIWFGYLLLAVTLAIAQPWHRAGPLAASMMHALPIAVLGVVVVPVGAALFGLLIFSLPRR